LSNDARLDNRTYYDEFADWYEKERHDGYHALIDDMQLDLLRDHVTGKDVLEIGCGTGLLLKEVHGLAKTARGIDISPGMLQLARKRGLDVVEGDATDLPYPDESFDVVYSFKVLAHVRDIERALEEAKRVTRPGGLLILEFYNRLSLRYLVKRLAGPQKISKQTDEGAVFTRWDSPMELARRVPAGLEIVDWAGVRVVTPAASVHRVPGVRTLVRHMEWRARDNGVLKYFGGFAVQILRKAGR
jgi:ubiquinone/menaquinone biosynthesis C-methylase UbiE